MTTTDNPAARARRTPLVRAFAALGLSAALIGLQATPGSAAATPKAGVQYVAIAHPVAASPREVVEVFWYDCPHSYQLAQPLRDWAARQNPPVTIRHIPAAWADQPEEMAYAHVYYTLDRLGLEDSLEQDVFHAVRDEHQDLTTLDSLSAWAEGEGVDPVQLAAAWNSPVVLKETQDAPALRERYDVHEMPSVVVGGEYRTSPFMGGDGVSGTVPVVDFLLQHSTAQAKAAADAKAAAQAKAKAAAKAKAKAAAKAKAHAKAHHKAPAKAPAKRHHRATAHR
ncbi:thiol:disulfide interchange protein DsbA/DsbL [Streptacidiphilus cavernicola]|uniref:Thiol:disulfide interchange protein DsbA n=1 Tax=Streptacidiphilus cavernicola TaxID=3342716 RepID=A0ABV6W540_9ACTN